MMQIASEMIGADTHALIDQRAKSHTRNGSYAGSSSNTTSQLPFSGKRKHWKAFKLKDAAARVKTAQEMSMQEDEQDMQVLNVPSRG